MKKKVLFIFGFVILLISLPAETAGEGNPEIFLGRIGFLSEFKSTLDGPSEEVELGIESSGNLLYKLADRRGDVVHAGMLLPGINTISIPVPLITGKNGGVFNLFLKSGDRISTREILLIPDRYEEIETAAPVGEGGAMNDRNRHEITVTGADAPGIDMHTRIVMDAVTGDYPGLNQGVPILPILYLLGSRVWRALKKKKRRQFPLYSETQLVVRRKEERNKNARLSIQLHNSVL